MIFIWDTPIMAELSQIIDDVRNTIRANGHDLLRKTHDVGTDIMVTCTEHKNGQEQKVSMGISKNEFVTSTGKVIKAGTVHCFTCGYTADLPTWIAKVLGLGNGANGFRWLIKRYSYGIGGERAELALLLDRGTTPQKPLVSEALINQYCIEFFDSDRAMDYMIGTRKIPAEVCTKFRIGYNRQNDSIVMPICDAHGNILFTKERAIGTKVYINGEHSDKSSTLFGLSEAIKMIAHLKRIGNKIPPIWVVEGEIDTMTLWKYGNIAVAQMGSELSDMQAKLLMRVHDRFVSAMDNDMAGKKGTRILKDKLIPLGARIYNLRYNCSKKDFNAMTDSEIENIELF